MPASASIRVLFLNLPAILSEFMTRLFAQDRDIVLVGSVQENIEALLKVRSGVDVVIMCAPRATPMPGVCSLLLTEFPLLRIVVIATGTEEAFAYYLTLTRQTLPSVDSETLIPLIRNLSKLDPTGPLPE